MDVLSEVLRSVKLQGALFFNGEFSSPWCLHNSGMAGLAPHVTADPEHLIIYHFLTDGTAYASLPDGQRMELAPGDIVVFPHGDAHLLGNGSHVKPIDSIKTFSKAGEGLRLVKFGGGGELTKFVCGFLACEPQLSEVFLAGLPPILKVNVLDEPSGQWLAQSIRFSVDETNELNAGSGLVTTKLAELLFVETLRRYINALPSEEIGWLAGARDEAVGRALALLHKEPSEPWTIAELSRRVGLSRTRLAERFTHFIGESPMAYLTRWRLKLAADILQSTDDSAAEVAVAVGYESEAGFNRAFKREFGDPPAQFRKKRRAATV
ncbi:MAG TPA: AraC family transcriptional regulator [Pyrinomonadaceae bacterium]